MDHLEGLDKLIAQNVEMMMLQLVLILTLTKKLTSIFTIAVCWRKITAGAIIAVIQQVSKHCKNFGICSQTFLSMMKTRLSKTLCVSRLEPAGLMFGIGSMNDAQIVCMMI